MGKKYVYACILSGIVLVLNIAAVLANTDNNKTDTTRFGKQQNYYDPVISAIDSLMYLKLSETNSEIKPKADFNQYNFAIDSIPIYHDLIYEYRMAELNSRSPIALEYNDAVKAYIDMYTQRKREQVARMLGLAQLYFPLFEETLSKYDLPMELKYLAVIESALNPNAKSKSGAVGLWQFLVNSAEMFDLKIDSYVDERSDPYKATDAACKYLEYLHRIFNDWQLALAAYNGGPGMVRNAINRSGGKTNFWEIRPYLPKETQGYVPAFIAANYVMNYTAEHNIQPIPPKIYFQQTDTIMINHSVYFEQINNALGIPMDLLKFLNPMYSQGYIPYSGESMVLVLPIDKISDFLQKEQLVYNSTVTKADFNTQKATAGATDNRLKIIHTVRRGEYFHKLAIRYKCTIDNIVAWNNLTTYTLNEGQKLEFWVDNSFDEPVDPKDVKPQNFFYYTVQQGDSMESIAEKFQCSIDEIKQSNNLSVSQSPQPGSQLKIYGK